MTFHRGRLLAALNKHWRPLSTEEYLHGMDLPATEDAVMVAGFPKEIIEWIWEPVKKKGLVWKS